MRIEALSINEHGTTANNYTCHALRSRGWRHSTRQTLKLARISLWIGFGIRRRTLRIKAVVCEALKVVHAPNVREKEMVPVKGAPATRHY